VLAVLTLIAAARGWLPLPQVAAAIGKVLPGRADFTA
jgi:hypothetical protein